MTKAVNETAKTELSAGVIDTNTNPNQCFTPLPNVSNVAFLPLADLLQGGKSDG